MQRNVPDEYLREIAEARKKANKTEALLLDEEVLSRVKVEKTWTQGDYDQYLTFLSEKTNP